MAPPFSSTFASAAASTNGENAGNRRDNATNEWSRSRVNGAAQTFRRTSTTTPSQTPTQHRESASTPNAGNEGVYIPPHLNANNSSRNLPLGDTRYGKDQLLNIYQSLKETSSLDRQLKEIFLGGWEPLENKTGAHNQAGRGDGKDSVPGPEVCWNYNADVEPLGLTSMSEEERQLFSTSVNSPIKLQQSNPKETSGPGVIGGRKASLSTYNNTSGGARPGSRRRDTSDSFMANGPLSPTENKTFPRTESNTATPPPALLRRRTDYREDDPVPSAKEELDPGDGADSQPSFPGLRRAGTGPLSAGLNPPSASPWSAGAQPSAFGSMGSFGSFAIGSATTPTESSEKRPGFGSARGGSRFKDLLSKTSSEDISQSIRDKTSFGALEKLPEEDAEAAQSRLRDELKTRPGRSETNPYEDASIRSGSAALSSAQENLPPPAGIEQMGMSAFAPPTNVGARDFGHDDSYPQTSHGRYNPHEPMSPTNTNPYHSPHGHLEDDEGDNGSISQAPGLPPFGTNRRNMFSSSDDRGPPTSSTRAASGFGSLAGFGGLGGAPGWPSAGLGSNKPVMDRGLGSAFADPIFSPLTDLQSPSASGFGGGFFGSGGFGSAGRASRLGAMFPPAMQEQMRGDSRNEMRHPLESRPDSAQQQSIRDAFDNTARRSEGLGRGSSLFDESPSMRSVEEITNASQGGQFGAPPSGPTTSTLTAPLPTGQQPGGDNYQSGHGLSQSSGSNSSNQLPAAQQRQMVMPDRMRWIYRDPQGNTQGPFSGLEMHDWFKAGFFTAELQVKKLEDVEYEPLAQLVRRIGNSREPFLVPQIGVPHGPPSATQGNHWANAPITGGGGSVQPPFASSFPSFGTTLTAEQQNALERRKQEEQFLMARQKEHLAQQQMAMKHMQMQNGMHSLQHHSSAQSLQSQPSFSSITSPTGYQPPVPGPIQPPQLGVPFSQSSGPTSAGPAFAGGREEDLPSMMDRMSFTQRAGHPFAGGPSGPPPEIGPSPQQLNSMLQDRARVQQQQQQADMRGHQDAFLGPQGRNDRLDEFHELRGQADLPAGRLGPEEPRPQPIGAQRHVDEPQPQKVHAPIGHPTKADHEPLSLAQQVQIAAASQLAAAEEHARGKKDALIEPPPVSISPLPAPAAQRNRQHVADALAAESRSATQTPIETPSVSIAPWAERTAEHPKGPSLKEIQEAEARRVAEQEQLAAAARRAQAEQEKLNQGSVPPPAPAPGLPSTSTWGAPASPVTPGSQSSSVWAKPTVAKPGAGANATAKKTLAQIQKEEESRKQRAAAAAAAAAANVQNAASPASAAAVGKRYAELASKVVPTTPTTSSAWTTVGSGGKTKAPPAVVATPQPASRTVSSTTVAAAKPRPTLQTSRSTTTSNQSKANEEFAKWIKGSLGKGLNSNINVDSFVQDLLQLPPEIEIISDSVYASSQTLDGRRFAEEFVRRRKLADKGIVEPATNGTLVGGMDKSAGGWSEVAKKGPVAAPKEENNASFKVVATKKKGKR